MRKISLFMLMAVGLLISGNLSAQDVAKIVETDIKYGTLTDALAAVESGQTIQLTANDIVEEANMTNSGIVCYTIPNGKEVTLDLNNHTISRVQGVDKSYEIFKVSGAGTKFIITDNSEEKGGLISMETTFSSGWSGVYNVDVVEGGTFVLEGGELRSERKNGAGLLFALNAIKANVEIQGGLINSLNYTAIRLFPTGNYEVKLTMSDGKIQGQYGIYVQHTTGWYNVDISGGEICTSGGFAFQDCIEKVDVSVANDKLSISGGTFNSNIDIAKPNPNCSSINTPTINITGGVFNGHYGVRTYHNEKNFISGGTFFFSNELVTEEKVITTPINFTTDDQGPVAIGNLGFTKYRGELATKEGWEALGYILKPATDVDDPGDWYYIWHNIKSTEDITTFKTYIADGYMAVDITGTAEGRTEGVWPDKTITIGEITQKEMSGTGTWNPEDSGETTAVTIADGANITIPAGTTVEAYSVNVPTGTTLNVEKGATLIVGAGGVTTATGEEVISINIGSNDGSGAIKISPDALADKAQPRVRIKLTTIAHKDAQGNSHWQYFARPTNVAPESFTVVEAADATEHYIRGYVGSSDSYIDITEPSQFENYEGYAITNNSTQGGVIYQFEGTLNANKNAEIKFKNKGFSLMGNSYLAPVSVEGLFKGIIEGATVAPATAPIAYKAPMEDGGNAVEWTIWIYNCANERFEQTNLLQAKAKKKQLQPMQGFFMKLREGTSLDAAIDYVGAVWNNNAQVGPILAPAYNENEMAAASIVVSANGNADQIDLFEGAEFDNTFNNGADASKLMNLQGMFNLYAQTEAGTLSCVASDNIEGTILTFQANNASEYELSFNGVENMNYSLIDLFNGEIIEMNESNVYKFNAVPNSTEARFQIVEGYKAPTAMEKVNNVKAMKGIFSMTGAYLGEAKDFNALPQGVYVVNGEKIVK